MHTYRNDKNRRITFQDKNGLYWYPGDEKKLEYFIPHELLGLTMIDEKPYVLRDPTRGYGYTEFLVKPGEKSRYDIPYSESIELSIHSPMGIVKMYIGDCLVPIVIDELHTHVSRYPWDMSAYLTFETENREKPVFIKVEPFTGKGE